jgi:hypothetical protein
MTTDPYIDDLDRMRSLLLTAESCPSLSDALVSLAGAEACERRLSHRADAPICTMAREALTARHRDRDIAKAALPALRDAARKASEAAIMYDRKNQAHFRVICSIDDAWARALELVERVAETGR